MNLINADQYHVQISLSHAEFGLLKGYVEDAAERDHGMLLDHPELLSGFRASYEQIKLAHAEGFLE